MSRYFGSEILGFVATEEEWKAGTVMKIFVRILCVVAVVGALAAGCNQQSEPKSTKTSGAGEKAGATVQKAGEKTGEALKTAGEKTGEAVKKATDATQEAAGHAMEKAGKAVEKAGEAIQDAGKAVAPPGK